MILTHQILFEFWTGATGAAAEQPAYIADWDEPDAGVHPRLLVSNVNGPTLATIRGRIASTHTSFWTALKSWCDSYRSRTDSYFVNEDAEKTGALAFAYLLDPTRTADADRAIDLAVYFAGLSGLDETVKREIVVAMAMVYDWCYDRLTTGERSTIRGGIATIVAGWYTPDPDEYLWGHSHGNISYAFVALCAILNDGSAGENTTWRGYMQTMTEAFDDGSNSCFWAAFGHFGNTDGGTHKGAGEYSYMTQNERFYIKTMPVMESALAVPAYANQAWWRKTMEWILWHWRGDQIQGLVQHESQQQAQWAIYTQIHAMQIAERESDALGEACQWLYDDINSVGNYRIYGAWYMYSILFWHPTRPATKPTIAAMGGQLKAFRNARTVGIRENWETYGFAMVIQAPRFTGGHSSRCGGHFAFGFLADAQAIRQGSYDPGEGTTYYEPAVEGRTGHRYVYFNQAIAHNCGRIFDEDEDDENMESSFRREYNKPNTFFGKRNGSDVVSNHGGQLWPKGAGGLYQPGDLEEFLSGTHPWNVETFPMEPLDTGDFAYVVVDCAPFYYSGKLTRFKRHFLYIPGTAVDPAWTRPILIIWDDRVTHIDAHATKGGKKTNIWQLQTNVLPQVASAAAWQYQFAHSRLFVKVLSPASVEGATITGYRDADGIVLTPTKTRAYDDSVYPTGAQPVRRELWPASASTDVDFLVVLYPAALTDDEGDLPAFTLFNDASYFGVAFVTPTGTRWWKMAKGDTHTAIYTTSEPPVDPPTKPLAPTGLQATPGDGIVTLDWDDNGESNLDYYKVYRRTKLNGTYGAWALLYSPSTSAYDDGSVVNDTTYQYYVTAVNTVPLESDPSDSTPDVTPEAEPDPPDPPTGQPAIDNLTRSAPMSIFSTVWPYIAEGGSITVYNQMHIAMLFAGFAPSPPAVDTSQGDPLDENIVSEDDDTPDAGTAIKDELPAATGGAAISPGSAAGGQSITDSIAEEDV